MNGTETLPRATREAVPRGDAERLEFMDALRGWAILCVLAVHTTMFTLSGLPHAMQNVVGQGARGVQLFYVVSAFTLFLSLSRRSDKERRPYRNFFIRRVFRIAPMFYVALVIFLLRDGFGPRYWLGDVPGLSTWNVLASVFFVNGWNPYTINSIVPIGWSVAIEMMFYLTIPFLFRRIVDLRGALWWTLSALVVSIALTQLMSRMPPIGGPELWHNFLFMWLPSQAPVFCLGILLFFAWKHFREELANWSICAGLLLVALACFGAYTLLPGHFAFGIAFVLLALGLSAQPLRAFVNPLTIGLGKISYSFYLTHLLILPLCARGMNRIYNATGVYHSGILEYVALFLCALVISSFVATACYFAIERPGMNLGRNIIKRLEAR